MLPFKSLANTPYLAGVAIGLATILLGWLVAGPQRRMMLIAGTVHLLQSPVGLWNAPAIWQPERLFGVGLPLEDAGFAFIFGAGSWIMATLLFRRGYAARGDALLFVRRGVLLSALSVAAFGSLLHAGFDATLPGLVVYAAAAGWLLLRYPDLRPLAVCGGLGCVFIYYIELRLWLVLYPDARNWWVADTLWNWNFIGVPLGEAAWALIVGAGHPIIMAFLCDVRRVDVRPS